MRVSSSAWRPALCAAAVLLATTAAANAADPVHVTPGNWEIASSIEMPNMPPRPPMTMTHCVKPEDVTDSHTFAERMQQRNGKCTFSDFKVGGDKMSYSFTCENAASGTSEVVFAGASYEATTKVTVGANGNRPAMTMISHVKARRVGDC
jgi:Protein of unknown function (DUF3617)